jgi:hypothetical protein
VKKIRLAFVDWWFGNEDEHLARVSGLSVGPCRKLVDLLAQRGVEVEIAFPPGPESRPDLAIFSAYGTVARADAYDGTLKLFWCNENLTLTAFAAYRDYQPHFDYYFTHGPTTDRNFCITSAIFHYQLPRLAAPRPPADIDRLLAAKTDFACFLYSNDSVAAEYDGVRLRNDFFRRLNRVRSVTSGGEVMNNTGGPVPRSETGAFLARHKFSIAFENSRTEGYITEKMVLAFLHGAVPIYCGPPDVGRYFNEQAFVLYTGQNFDEVLERLQRLDRNVDEYARMLAAPKLITPLHPDYRPEALDRRMTEIIERVQSARGAVQVTKNGAALTPGDAEVTFE